METVQMYGPILLLRPCWIGLTRQKLELITMKYGIGIIYIDKAKKVFAWFGEGKDHGFLAGPGHFGDQIALLVVNE